MKIYFVLKRIRNPPPSRFHVLIQRPLRAVRHYEFGVLHLSERIEVTVLSILWVSNLPECTNIYLVSCKFCNFYGVKLPDFPPSMGLTPFVCSRGAGSTLSYSSPFIDCSLQLRSYDYSLFITRYFITNCVKNKRLEHDWLLTALIYGLSLL